MTEDAIVVGKIQITADVRTNRVHVVTRPVNMPLVRRLIAEYDANTPFADPVKRRLKYVSARDPAHSRPVADRARRRPGGGGAPRPGAGGRANRPAESVIRQPEIATPAMWKQHEFGNEFRRQRFESDPRPGNPAGRHVADRRGGGQHEVNRRSARQCDHRPRQRRGGGSRGENYREARRARAPGSYLRCHWGVFPRQRNRKRRGLHSALGQRDGVHQFYDQCVRHC